jgi:mutator protein MutT
MPFPEPTPTDDSTVHPPKPAASAAHVVRGVLGIIRCETKHLLMIRRAQHLRIGGVWCFPGGHIESGESDQAALIREMREELGIDVQPISLVTTLTKNEGRLILHAWTARLETMDVRPDPREVAAWRWMTPEEIRAMPKTDHAQPPGEPDHVISGTIDILDRL